MYRVVVAFTCLMALSLIACTNDRRGGPEVMLTDAGGVVGDAGTPIMGTDGGTTPGGGEPGSACNCDSACAGTASNAGLCVQGICMHRSTADCSAAGSTAECPAGSRCWGLTGVTGGICWPDCDAHACAGACDSDGSCAPTDSSTCDASCSEICSSGGGTDGGTGGCPPHSHPDGDGCVCDTGYTVNADRTACVPPCSSATDCSGGDICVEGVCQPPPCTATSCPSGTICDPSGTCVIDIGTAPPGPVPTCAAGVGSVPDWRCTAGAAECGRIVAFEPVTGTGYDNYPINGETASNQYRSFIRRDVMMLIKYAAAMVDCQARAWTFANGGPVGLGDMSEADGAIPGTSIGSPGHPAGTHVDGHDMDIGYFQTGTANNRLREVCPHTSGGAEQYHCTGAPNLLDPWRTALFIGHLHASPQLRVIGVDGRVGPPVSSAIAQLCTGGWLSGSACSSSRMTYETTDEGRGWFLFHHHHLHVSVSSP